ncbi:MAG: Fatty acid oxidation complex subunit alpha [Pseudomonadota bacterium]
MSAPPAQPAASVAAGSPALLSVVKVMPGVAQITLCSPKRRNAFSREMVAAIRQCLNQALALGDCHTVVFRSESEDFSTGFDVGGLDQETDESLRERFREIEALLVAVYTAPFRTVALARGRTWGAAADLVVSCDARWVIGEAEFRFPGARFGLVLGSRRLAARLGRDRARQLLFSGQALGTAAAISDGLVHRAFQSEADALAALGQPPVMGKHTLLQVWAATSAGEEDLLRDDRRALELSMTGSLKQRLLDYVQAQQSRR